MPPDKTIDTVLMIIALGLLTLGLGSVVLGKIVAWLDEGVKRSDFTITIAEDTNGRTNRTNEANEPSAYADDLECLRLEVDRTKQAAIDVMVYNGWTVTEIRSVLKGESKVLGEEIEAARHRLGIEPPDRTLRVRDERGERVIPLT